MHTGNRLSIIIGLAALLPTIASAQGDDADARAGHETEERKRILWIIPNYRTSPTLKDYQPLGVKQKFAIASQDALDPGTFVLAGLFAAEGQLTTAAPSFGGGLAASSKYYAASLTDFVVGDLMTEAIYPSLLRQDPRYFRRGTGGGLARLGSALGQIVWTHTDRGGSQFNVSEIVGNATAVGIGNAYYPDNRTLSSNVSKLLIQLGVDAASNVLKEFAPDLDRLFSRKPLARSRAPKASTVPGSEGI